MSSTFDTSELRVPAPLVNASFATPAEVAFARQTVELLIDVSGAARFARRAPNRWEAPLHAVPGAGTAGERLLVDLRARTLYATRELVATEKLWPEFTLLAANYPGDSHILHADNRTFDAAANAWVPNHTPERTASAILYFATHGVDFTGGELLFPGNALTVQPSAGLLVAFPSNERYQHEVLPIRSGVRLSMAMWFTDNAARIERLPAW